LELASASRRLLVVVDSVQRAVDLAKPFGGGLAELVDQHGEALDVGLHALLHLTEALIDELLAPGQSGLAGLGLRTELCAAHRDDLLDGGLHGTIAFASRAFGGVGHGERHRPGDDFLRHLCHLSRHRLGHDRYDGAAGRHQPGEGGRGGGHGKDEQVLHVIHHGDGVSHSSRMRPDHGSQRRNRR
jgi:hypothetical protein